MCTETFLRLPEEKRTRFLDAAWEEFSVTPFAEASINKIVLRAGIPRGSFYQYFSDKKELFYYLLKNMLDHFLQEYCQSFQKENGDMFRTQIRCYERVLLEKNTHPLFVQGIRILRLNVMYLSQAIIESQLPYHIWDAVKEYIDLSGFRGKDEEFGKQTFVMSLMILVFTMTEAMSRPEQVEVCRQELVERMEILRNGSLEKQLG